MRALSILERQRGSCPFPAAAGSNARSGTTDGNLKIDGAPGRLINCRACGIDPIGRYVPLLRCRGELHELYLPIAGCRHHHRPFCLYAMVRQSLRRSRSTNEVPRWLDSSLR